jgi:hypothetical protein
MVDEWRIKKRYPLTAWVNLIATETGTTRRGYVTNISREGVGLYYLGTVGAGQDVTLTMHMLGPSGSEIVETASGRLIWEDQWGGITIMGVKFDRSLGENAPTILDRMTRADGNRGQPLRSARPSGSTPPPRSPRA